MVSSALRALGLRHVRTFQTYHRVRNRASWSSLGASRIARTTSALLGLYSLVTLLAYEPMTSGTAPPQQTAWYTKTKPAFSDALALVRRRLWTQTTLPTSPCGPDIEQIPRALLDHLTGLLCYAA